MLALGLVILIIIYLEWTQKAPDRILLFSLLAVITFSLINWYWADAQRLEKSGVSIEGDDQIYIWILECILLIDHNG